MNVIQDLFFNSILKVRFYIFILIYANTADNLSVAITKQAITSLLWINEQNSFWGR